MSKFCGFCGRPLMDGETCSCRGQASGSNGNSNKEVAQGFWEAFKNRIGIGDPERNHGDAFEKDKQIVPDCVTSNETEIPVKQYEIATLRSRILCIPFSKAIGRLQVTNKRVIFRAPGRCLAGRTTLQHEFAIDEIAGLEARREFVFHFFDMLLGWIVAIFGGSVLVALITELFKKSIGKAELAGPIIFAFMFGAAGLLPFFFLKKKWLLKILCLGGSFLPMMSFGSMANKVGGDGEKFFGFLLTFSGVVVLLLTLVTVFIYAIKPNLVLIIKTKSANGAVDIQRQKIGRGLEDHTGYKEVIPADDAERCIREVDALINDIQKLGDFGIEKWKKEHK